VCRWDKKVLLTNILVKIITRGRYLSQMSVIADINIDFVKRKYTMTNYV